MKQVLNHNRMLCCSLFACFCSQIALFTQLELHWELVALTHHLRGTYILLTRRSALHPNGPHNNPCRPSSSPTAAPVRPTRGPQQPHSSPKGPVAAQAAPTTAPIGHATAPQRPQRALQQPQWASGGHFYYTYTEISTFSPSRNIFLLYVY